MRLVVNMYVLHNYLIVLYNMIYLLDCFVFEDMVAKDCVQHVPHL